MRALIQKKSFLGLVALLFLTASKCNEKDPVKPIINPVPLYRLWNDQVGDHFYTTSVAEKNAAVSIYRYVYEGIACNVDTVQATGNVPFYRLWNEPIGDHFYTTNLTEKNAELSRGSRDEGIACYVYETTQTKTIPLYRTYNSTSGDHFYTTNLTERDNSIKNSGYIAEGIACYVFP